LSREENKKFTNFSSSSAAALFPFRIQPFVVVFCLPAILFNLLRQSIYAAELDFWPDSFQKFHPDLLSVKVCAEIENVSLYIFLIVADGSLSLHL
jgi:hypothetical protein